MKKLTKTIIIAALTASHVTLAANIAFNNGGGDGSWETATNWVGGALPTSTDSAQIQANASLSSAQNVSGVLVYTAELVINSGGSITATSVVNIGQATTTDGILTINTGGTLTTTNGISLGPQSVNASGTLNLNGGTINSANHIVGRGNTGATRAESFLNFNAGTASFRNFEFNDIDLTNVVFNWALSGTSTVANISVTSASFANDLAAVDTFNFTGGTLVNGDVVTLISGSGGAFNNLSGIAVTGIASGGVLSQVGNDLVLTVIPEPSSLMLLTGGLLSLAFYRRRKA